MESCMAHAELVTDIAVIKTTVTNLDKRINGSIDAIEKHIDNGYKFRTAMTIAGVGLLLTIITNIVVVSFLLGQMNKQIAIDSTKIDKLETLHIAK